jgi:type IV pilus assembly protein PilB
LSNLPKGIKIPALNNSLKIPQVSGCSFCNNTGYKGRVGIFEAFLVDDKMEKFIMTSPSVAALKEKAIGGGMATLFQDGLIKVLERITTIEEVEKTTGE